MNRIEGFFKEHRFLSNFYPVEVPIVDEYEGVTFIYGTVEHAYQAMKTLSLQHRREIMMAETPGAAKRIGQRAPLRRDWDNIKYDVMLELTRAKYYHSPGLKQRLIATGDAELYEVNNWGDRYWGCDEFLEGQNRLGEILMQVREEVSNQF